jgi:hypothetical protein
MSNQKNVIHHWIASGPDSTWQSAGVVHGYGSTTDTFPSGSNFYFASPRQYRPWHIKVVDNGADNKIVIFSCQDSTDNGYALFIGQTFDGNSLSACHTPIMDRAVDDRWDALPYRATGWFNERNGYRCLDLLYSAIDSSASARSGYPHYATGLTSLYFGWPWQRQVLSNFRVTTTGIADDDSMALYADMTQGTSTSQRSYLWIDSTWQGTDTMLVSCYLDIEQAFDADSLAIWYLTNGKIDDFTVYSNAAASAGQPVCDSSYASSTTDRTSTTLARIAVALNHDFIVGDRIRVVFTDVLADDNDRTKVARIELIGKRRQ